MLDGARIILRGNLQRPDDGKVANNGNFILNDGWQQVVFRAFSSSGEKLIAKKFDTCLAGAETNAISDDGQWAVCCAYIQDSDEEVNAGETDQFLAGEGEDLWLFDLAKKKLRAHFKTVLSDPSQFRFDATQQILYVSHKDGLVHRYSFDGNFLDSAAWQTQSVRYANGYQLLFAVEARLRGVKGADPVECAEIISLLELALSKGVTEYLQAKIHRFLGETWHRCGDNPKAIAHFETALRLNPKNGIKKLLARLKAECEMP